VIPKEWLEFAQVASSFAAVVGLLVAACQIYRARLVAEQSRRVADLQAVQKFFQDVNERESALSTAGGDRPRLHAFNEFLNFWNCTPSPTTGTSSARRAKNWSVTSLRTVSTSSTRARSGTRTSPTPSTRTRPLKN
jgi:hypothetical protein